mmetsp:Transcript_27486/g.69279  ORF Transcript_27486/g.69279 Transcript_27486/m.69279 type:complete len:104 (+) Transcript_27486:1127-1438(+)
MTPMLLPYQAAIANGVISPLDTIAPPKRPAPGPGPSTGESGGGVPALSPPDAAGATSTLRCEVKAGRLMRQSRFLRARTQTAKQRAACRLQVIAAAAPFADGA